MAEQTGQTCKLFRNNGGSWASPTWAEINNVENLKAPLSRTKAEASKRASAYKKYLPGMMDLGISFNMPRDVADADYIALRTAFLAGTAIIVAYATGPIATVGTRYVKLEVIITKFDEDEPLDGACMVDIELAPDARSANDPTDTTVP